MMTLTDLYQDYEGKLKNYARRLTGDSQQAEDLVQDTFIRAMGHLELLKILKPHQQQAWLYRTLKNLFFDEQNARRRQAAFIEGLTQEISAATYLIEEVISPNPFELVPDRYRDLFRKRYVLGMTSQEIAKELGLPPATVRSRLHLALKEVRAKKAKLM